MKILLFILAALLLVQAPVVTYFVTSALGVHGNPIGLIFGLAYGLLSGWAAAQVITATMYAD